MSKWEYFFKKPHFYYMKKKAPPKTMDHVIYNFGEAPDV